MNRTIQFLMFMVDHIKYLVLVLNAGDVLQRVFLQNLRHVDIMYVEYTHVNSKANTR